VQNRAEESLVEFERLSLEHSEKIKELEDMKSTYSRQKKEYAESLESLATLQSHLDGLEVNSASKKEAIRSLLEGYNLTEADLTSEDNEMLRTLEYTIKNDMETEFNARTGCYHTHHIIIADEDMVINRFQKMRKNVSFDSSVNEREYTQSLLAEVNLDTDESSVDAALLELDSAQQNESQVQEDLLYLNQLKDELENKRRLLRQEFDSVKEDDNVEGLIGMLKDSSVDETNRSDDQVVELDNGMSNDDQISRQEDTIDHWMEVFNSTSYLSRK